MYDQQIPYLSSNNGGRIWYAFYVVSQSKKIKQHKSVGVLIVCHFFDVTIVT